MNEIESELHGQKHLSVLRQQKRAHRSTCVVAGEKLKTCRFLEKGSTKKIKKEAQQPTSNAIWKQLYAPMTVPIIILPKIQTLFTSMLTGCMSLFTSISILVSHIQTAHSFSSKFQRHTEMCVVVLWIETARYSSCRWQKH